MENAHLKMKQEAGADQVRVVIEGAGQEVELFTRDEDAARAFHQGITRGVEIGVALANGKTWRQAVN